jgi:molybdopterin molybdotransferase
VKQLLDKLGEVLFWKIAMKPGAARVWPHRQRAFLRPAGQSGLGDGDVLSVRARRAADIAGRRDVLPVPTFKATWPAPIRKAPGRTNSSAASSRPAATAVTVRTTATRVPASCRRCRRRIASSCPDRDRQCRGRETSDVQLLEGLL